jgi:hypothetical protein
MHAHVSSSMAAVVLVIATALALAVGLPSHMLEVSSHVYDASGRPVVKRTAGVAEVTARAVHAEIELATAALAAYRARAAAAAAAAVQAGGGAPPASEHPFAAAPPSSLSSSGETVEDLLQHMQQIGSGDDVGARVLTMDHALVPNFRPDKNTGAGAAAAGAALGGVRPSASGSHDDPNAAVVSFLRRRSPDGSWATEMKDMRSATTGQEAPLTATVVMSPDLLCAPNGTATVTWSGVANPSVNDTVRTRSLRTHTAHCTDSLSLRVCCALVLLLVLCFCAAGAVLPCE